LWLKSHHLLHQKPAEAGDRLAEAVALTKETFAPA